MKNQPYRLAADVWGIGFLTADRIAQSVGIPHDSPERVKAGLQYALSQSTDQGHCYLPEERLIADAVKLLQVDTGLVIDCLGRTGRRGRGTWCDGSRCPARRTASRSRRSIWCPSTGPRSRSPPSCSGCCAPPRTACPAFQDVDWDAALGWLAGRTGAELAPEQRQAVRLALTREGRRADGRARLRQVVHGAVGGGAGPGQEGQGGARGAHRPGRQAARRADRGRGVHGAPAAGAEARRGRRVRQGPAAGRRPGGRRRGVDARSAAGQQAGQGGAAGRPSAAGGRCGPAAVRRRRRGAARSARRRRPGARGPAEADLPPGAAVRGGDQRAPDQLRGAARHPRIEGFLPLRRGRHGGGRAAHRGRGGPPHPREVRPRPPP